MEQDGGGLAQFLLNALRPDQTEYGLLLARPRAGEVGMLAVAPFTFP